MQKVKFIMSLALMLALIVTFPGINAFADDTDGAVEAYTGRLYWNSDGESFRAGCNWGFDLLTEGDNKEYSNDLAMVSLLLAVSAYSNSGDAAAYDGANMIFDGYNYGRSSKTGAWEALGFEDCRYVDITAATHGAKGEKDKDVDDITTIIMGHKRITVDGVDKEVFVCSVRGTNGTYAEWSSNFDVGADSSDYHRRNAKDWINKKNHKGFDVTATRAMKELDAYIEAHVGSESDDEKIILLNGHSRGGAIANIMGTIFEDRSDWKPFTYTFASPNTTTASDADSYETIWNVINEDDLVAALPYDFWGFTRYGNKKSISVAKNEDLEEQAEAYAGWYDYFVATSSMKSSLQSAARKIASDRKDLYKIPTAPHSLTSGVVYRLRTKSLSTVQAEFEEYGFTNYCTTSSVGAFFGLSSAVEVRPAPAFCMQWMAYLAAYGNPQTLVLDLPCVEMWDVYADFRTAFVAAGAGYSLEDPHCPVTYYTIVENGF